MQHAHQKGIIHRDIKPSNVLVTRARRHAGREVIDFGVAKATGQQLTEKTLFTNFAPDDRHAVYMSPEQAELSGLDIDTRSDIYSLGVLLYELLTGTTPFDREQLQAGQASTKSGGSSARRSRPSPARGSARSMGELRRRWPVNRKSDPETAEPVVSRRAGLDRDEGAGEGPQPPLRDGQRLGGRRASATSTMSRCRPARRRRCTDSASSPGETKRHSRNGERHGALVCSWQFDRRLLVVGRQQR